MEQKRKKLATQVEVGLLAEIRQIANRDGRQLQAVVEDAFRIYLEERKRTKPRVHVIAHYAGSHDRFASLYERLAK